MKLNACLILTFLLLLASCTIDFDAAEFIKGNSYAQEFLLQYPNAGIKLVRLSIQQTSDMIDEISEDCGLEMEVKEYYRITINDSESGLRLVIYIDAVTQETSCLVKKQSIIPGELVPEEISVSDLPEPSGKPRIDLYIMSLCPYAREMMKSISSVVTLLDQYVEFSINYIAEVREDDMIWSLNGQNEIDQDMIQLCAKKYDPANFFGLFYCQFRSVSTIPTNWISCAEQEGIDVHTIEACYEDGEGEQLLRASIRETENRGVKSSPTLYINGVLYNDEVTYFHLLDAVCDVIEEEPEGCQGGFRTCLDSETQRVGKVKGKVTYLDEVYYDTCLNDDKVKEVYCKDGKPLYVYISCGDYYKCVDGACVADWFCRDSDPDMDKYNKGTCKIYYGGEVKEILEDECQDSLFLRERYCEEDSSSVQTSVIRCFAGCDDGVCLPEECIDSDNGFDYHKKGRVTYLGQASEDYCRTDIGLVEYYCSGDRIGGGQYYLCSNEGKVCRNGACVDAASTTTTQSSTTSSITPTTSTTTTTGAGFAISSCGRVLRESGTYTLTKDVSFSTRICIETTGKDITIDCQHHTISGIFNQNPDPIQQGIYINGTYYYDGDNIEIKNCHINNVMYGIYSRHARNSIFNDNTITNGLEGIFLDVFSDSVDVTNNVISDNTRWGINCFGADNVDIENNQVSNNDGGIYAGEDSVFIGNNIIDNNDEGILAINSNPTITSNTITNNNVGIKCFAGEQPQRSGNACSGNTKACEGCTGEPACDVDNC
ncbi:right-handed parallel beta-helix repeat-containing protein [Candidatus Woesearchaeota archaeon]|nr:right-handed parallel beta-helix repeat-containing protein [Candidatus Woesearchaeota archaeon]